MLLLACFLSWKGHAVKGGSARLYLLGKSGYQGGFWKWALPAFFYVYYAHAFNLQLGAGKI